MEMSYMLSKLPKGGIYMIKNTITGERYIGKTNNFEKRKKEHFSKLENKKHGNYLLQNSCNKYGIENFEFVIVEYMKYDKDRTKQEQYLIDKWKPEYNIALISKDSEISIESRRKMSIAMKKRCEDPIEREKRSIIMKKRYEDPIEREKTSIVMRKVQQKRWEDPTEREKMSITLKKLYENPTEREKMSIALKKSWEKRRLAKLQQENPDTNA